MSLKDSIRTIAKTDEIKRILDKLNIKPKAVDKNKIEGFRVSTYQTGTGTIASSQGTTNGIPADGVDGTNAVVAPEPTKTTAPTSTSNNTSTSNTSGGLTGGGSSGGASTGGFSQGTGTNMSGNVSSTGGGSAGSTVQTQAQGGANDAELQATLDSIDALTQYSEADRNRMKEEFTRSWLVDNYGIEPGSYTAKEIADGASYVPKPLEYNSVLNSMLSITNLDAKPKIKSVVGFDKNGELNADGSVKAVKINLDKLDSFIPSIMFPPQDGWDDPNTPPVDPSWVDGSVWTVVFGGTRYFNATFSGLLGSLVGTGGAAVYSYGSSSGVGGDDTITSIPAKSSDQSVLLSLVSTGNVGDTYSDVGGDTYLNIGDALAVTGLEIGRVLCNTYGGDGAACAISNPTLTEWEDNGYYALAYLNGKFVNNVYNRLVPLEWQLASSYVELALGDGVNVIDTRKMGIEMATNGGTILSILDGSSLQSATLLDKQGVPISKTTSTTTVDTWRP